MPIIFLKFTVIVHNCQLHDYTIIVPALCRPKTGTSQQGCHLGYRLQYICTPAVGSIKRNTTLSPCQKGDPNCALFVPSKCHALGYMGIVSCLYKERTGTRCTEFCTCAFTTIHIWTGAIMNHIRSTVSERVCMNSNSRGSWHAMKSVFIGFYYPCGDKENSDKCGHFAGSPQEKGYFRHRGEVEV